MKAVLLATGLAQTPASVGTRSRAPNRSISMRPLIDVAIESFILAGFDEVGVVLHDNQGLLQRYLEDGSRYGAGVYTMRSENDSRGRVASLLAARTFVGGEPFVLAVGTSALDPVRLQNLSRFAWAPCAIGARRRTSRHRPVNRRLRLWHDARGRIEQVGEELERWNALADNTFLFQPEVFQDITTLLQASDGRCSLARLLRYLIQLGETPQACLGDAGEFDVPDLAGNWRTPLPVLSVLFSPEYLPA